MPHQIDMPRLISLLLLAMVCVAHPGCGDAQKSPPGVTATTPNVIVVTLDDATAQQVNRRTMPTAFAELAQPGTTFENFIAPSPLCCPSRAAFLTGQYGHNNHVLKNDYRRLGSKGNILPRWLQGRGYRTAHVGKYLNNFTAALDDPADVPWGWDEWFTLLDNGYYDYRASDNGEKAAFGEKPDDYVTRVLNQRALEFVERSVASEQPFYLQLDQYAPHPHVAAGPEDDCRGGATIDPDDYASLRDAPFPKSRSTNEEDVSDKPWFIQRADRLTRQQLDRRKNHHLCASAALRPVDRGLREIVEALRRSGDLKDTAIFLTSDNGFFYGEHRIPANKEFPYEENLRMPLLVRWPNALAGKGAPRRVDALAANIDLAPTILELTGAEPCDGGKCRPIDGRSLLPLLSSPDADWPRERALLVELDQSPSGVQSRPRPCSYIGVRTAEQLYVQHRTAAAPGTPCRPTDAIEHYDLRRDPDQLDNLAASRSAKAERRMLGQKLRDLSDCEGNAAAGDDSANPCE